MLRSKVTIFALFYYLVVTIDKIQNLFFQMARLMGSVLKISRGRNDMKLDKTQEKIKQLVRTPVVLVHEHNKPKKIWINKRN